MLEEMLICVFGNRQTHQPEKCEESLISVCPEQMCIVYHVPLATNQKYNPLHLE